MLAENRTAVAMQGIGSDGATKTGLLPSMRNPSTCRVLRRAWTVGRLAGSLRFPPCSRILPTGSSLSIRNPALPSEPPSIPFDQASVRPAAVLDQFTILAPSSPTSPETSTTLA
jgi:hypothetical protein